MAGVEVVYQPDLGLFRHEEILPHVVFSAIVRQQLVDRTLPYLGDPELTTQRDIAWTNLARLNPDYSDKVLAFKQRMENAKRYKDVGESMGEDDWLLGCFSQMANRDTRIILMDILKDSTGRPYFMQEQVGDEECDIYDAILENDFPLEDYGYVRGDQISYPTFPGYSPERVIALAVNGVI